MTVRSTQRAKGLRPNCLSFPEVLAQSVALTAPSGGIALNAALVFASAGNGTWLAFLIATVGLVLVSFNINQFARHSASAGALYTYVARGLGPTAGILCGWALTLAYLFVATAVVASFSHYVNIVLNEFGLQLPSLLLIAICVGVAWYYAYTDIQLSALLMLFLELVSIGAILILIVLVLAKQGVVLDTAQFSLKDVTPNGLSLGLVLAIFGFVGFESAATLGDEAKKPTRTIPRSLVWSAVFSGLFFILVSYTEVLGFHGFKTPLNESAYPLSDLANIAGVDLLGVGINVGIAFSFLSCCLASLNAAARIAFALSRHHFYLASLGESHTQNATPYVAVNLASIAVFLVAGSMSLFGIQDLDIYGYIGTISTYGFLFAYILVSIAAPFYLSRQGKLRQHHVAISILAVLLLMIPVVGSVYPAPAFPFNIFPYLFLLYLVVGGWLFLTRRHRSLQVSESMRRDFETTQNS